MFQRGTNAILSTILAPNVLSETQLGKTQNPLFSIEDSPVEFKTTMKQLLGQGIHCCLKRME